MHQKAQMAIQETRAALDKQNYSSDFICILNCLDHLTLNSSTTISRLSKKNVCENRHTDSSIQ